MIRSISSVSLSPTPRRAAGPTTEEQASEVYRPVSAPDPGLTDAARALFSQRPAFAAAVRRESIPVTNALAPPHGTDDGSVVVAGTFHHCRVGGPDFRLTAQSEFYEDELRGDSHASAYGPDGTAYFVTRSQSLRGLRPDGSQACQVELPGPASCGPAVSADRVACGLSDGRVLLYDRAGKLQSHFQLPPGAGWARGIDFSKKGGLYVETLDVKTQSRFLVHVRPDGSGWPVVLDTRRFRYEPLQPLETSTGPVLVDAHQGLRALDPQTGEELWRARLGADLVTEPVEDSQGRVWALTADGNLHRLGPRGEAEARLKVAPVAGAGVNRARCRLAVDCHDNLVFTANPGELRVLSADGQSLLRLTSQELFGQLDYLHDFSLSADRTRAYVLAGAYGLAEVELRSADQIVEDQTQQAMEQITTPQEPVPIIRKDEETVTIGGITLPRRNLVKPQES